MRAYIGEGIRYKAYYISTGRKNTRIEKTGVGIITAQHEGNYYIVDIGIRSIIVNTDDITKNYGDNPPFTVQNIDSFIDE